MRLKMRTFGSDPELFIFNNNKPYSAIKVLKGDKDNRTKIRNHEFYYDNTMAECAIKPSLSKEETIANFKECFEIYADLVKPFKLVPLASARFAPEELEHEDARKVGCEKDFCPYLMKQMSPPVNEILNDNLRSCGGHIHIGSEILKNDGSDPILFIYMLDLFLAIPSLWIDKDKSSIIRRKLYGQAGRYRVKEYGLEYRSLSNFWIKSPKLVELIYDICMFSLDFLESGKANVLWSFDIEKAIETSNLADAWHCNAYDPSSLIKAIDTSDKNLALDYFKLCESFMPKPLFSRIKTEIQSEDEVDFYESWGLK